MPGDALTILHLSDPQFGKNHVFGKRALPLADGKHDTLLARTLEDLALLKQEWSGLAPDLIVMTGDLAEWGEEEEFQLAFDFLGGVAKEILGIESAQRHRVAIIPGNHDVNRNLAEAEFALWRARGKKGEPFGFLRWEHYAAAFQAFYNDVPDDLVEVPGLAEKVCLRPTFTKAASHSLFIVPEFKTVLAGLNSTLAECHLDAKNAKKLLGKDTIYGHHGWCGEDQYKHFAAKLSPFEAADWLRVGLVHHNYVRGDTEDEENLRDAAHLRDHLSSKLNLLLHGHTHVADRAALPQGQPVLSTGSGALSQAQRPYETPNQYQVLRLSSDGVTAWMRAFDHHSRRWIPDARVGGEKSPGRLWLPHAFQKASATLGKSKRHALDAAPTAGQTPADSELPHRLDRELKSERQEGVLASQLTQIAQLRWPDCTTEWHETEPPYVSVVTDEDYGYRSFPIGLLRGSLSLEDVAQFDAQTSSYSWERWLVCDPKIQLAD
ncbi:MAG: metallophosphoesterase family protein, partial [Roseimicrobium sp.]